MYEDQHYNKPTTMNSTASSFNGSSSSREGLPFSKKEDQKLFHKYLAHKLSESLTNHPYRYTPMKEMHVIDAGELVGISRDDFPFLSSKECHGEITKVLDYPSLTIPHLNLGEKVSSLSLDARELSD